MNLIMSMAQMPPAAYEVFLQTQGGGAVGQGGREILFSEPFFTMQMEARFNCIVIVFGYMG